MVASSEQRQCAKCVRGKKGYAYCVEKKHQAVSGHGEGASQLSWGKLVPLEKSNHWFTHETQGSMLETCGDIVLHGQETSFGRLMTDENGQQCMQSSKLDVLLNLDKGEL